MAGAVVQPGHRRLARLRALAVLIIAAALTCLPAPVAAQQGMPTPLTAVARENALPGTTSWELTSPAANGEIAGYASATSVGAGQQINFSVSTTAPIFSAYIYRMGWYNGDGGRLMSVVRPLPGHTYATPTPDPATGLVICHWPAAFSIVIPPGWLSGVYLVKLVTLTNRQSYIPFVVRAPSPSTYVFVHSANTDEAYNEWGGASLYGNAAYDGAGSIVVDGQTETMSAYHRAVKVSFDRPNQIDYGAGTFFFWEYHMVRWMEEQGYDVSYASDVDLDDNPSALAGAHAILIVGHNEYWSSNMRMTVQHAIDTGTNLAVFGGNTLSWRVTYEPLNGDADRIIVCYKDAQASPFHDPRAGTEGATTYWRQRPLSDPESDLLGLSYGGAPPAPLGQVRFPWVVTGAGSWVYAGTSLHDGDEIPSLIGDEYDEVIPFYPQPPNLQLLADSPVVNSAGSRDHQNASLYTATSGARVFDAGEIDWSFGLDAFNPPELTTARADHLGIVLPAVQIMTRNILANFAIRAVVVSPWRGEAKRNGAVEY